MFEYLMPPLLMHSYPDTLIDSSASASIGPADTLRTRKEGALGVSESGFLRL